MHDREGNALEPEKLLIISRRTFGENRNQLGVKKEREEPTFDVWVHRYELIQRLFPSNRVRIIHHISNNHTSDFSNPLNSFL